MESSLTPQCWAHPVRALACETQNSLLQWQRPGTHGSLENGNNIKLPGYKISLYQYQHSHSEEYEETGILTSKPKTEFKKNVQAAFNPYKPSDSKILLWGLKKTIYSIYGHQKCTSKHADKMAQLLMILATKMDDDLSLIPSAHTRKREWLPQVVSWPLHTFYGMHTQTHIHTYK